MNPFLIKTLYYLPPESAHAAVLTLLKNWQHVGCLWAPQKIIDPSSKNIFRKPLRHRLGLAAGFDKNAEIYRALGELGFAFIEVGTVTPKPQSGNPKPRIWRKDGNVLLNSLGFNNCGVKTFAENLKRYAHKTPAVLLANIGKGRETPNERAIEDYALLVKELEGLVDGFVINISSPNTPGLRDLQSVEFISKIQEVLPNSVPSFLKLSPDLGDIQLKEICLAVNKNYLSGLVLTNTSRALAEKIYQMPQGGLSGEPLFSRSLECVRIARAALEPSKWIIGVGGIDSAERAQQMFSAGADLIEIYTAFVYQGPNAISNICKVP